MFGLATRELCGGSVLNGQSYQSFFSIYVSKIIMCLSSALWNRNVIVGKVRFHLFTAVTQLIEYLFFLKSFINERVTLKSVKPWDSMLLKVLSRVS